MSRVHFTDKDRAEMRRLRKQGASRSEVALRFGASKRAVDYAIYEHIGPIKTEPVRVPASVLKERDHRLGLIPRDTTAVLMGDPPVGYSALERRA